LNFLFAWRYFTSKKSTTAINIIAWISVVAIAVGTAALIIVLSVFNGFEDLVKSLYGDFYSSMKIAPANGKVITLTQEQLNKIRNIQGINGISLIAEEKALLLNGDNQSIVYLKGVDDNYLAVNKLGKHILRGQYNTGNVEEPMLVIGAGIESAVAVDAGKSSLPLTVYIPNRGAKNFKSGEALHSYNVQVSASFLVQQDFDNKYAFTNLAFLKYMLDFGADEYSSAEVAVANEKQSEKIQQQLQAQLGNGYTVQTRYQQNQSLYNVMRMEKWFIYILLSLILVVAAFNMIGALTMLVLEKQKDIAVLKAMGANNSSIKKIFLTTGVVLAGVGAISGIGIAVIVCWLQVKYKLIPLQGGSFIIDYYPVKMQLFDFCLVATTVVVIALLAAWVPSKKAGKQAFELKS
jgi:lipoprotein-releasing system permease protein